MQADEELPPPPGVREVEIDRPNIQTSFGFVLQSNTLRPGCMICEQSSGTGGRERVGDDSVGKFRGKCVFAIFVGAS